MQKGSQRASCNREKKNKTVYKVLGKESDVRVRRCGLHPVRAPYTNEFASGEKLLTVFKGSGGREKGKRIILRSVS